MTTTPASECSEGGGGGGGGGGTGAVGAPLSDRTVSQLPVPVPVRPLWPAHLGSAPHAYTPFFISNILGLQRPSAFGLFRAPAAYPSTDPAAAEEEPLNLTVRSGSPRGPEGTQEHAPEVPEVTEVTKPAGKAARKGEDLTGVVGGRVSVCLCSGAEGCHVTPAVRLGAISRAARHSAGPPAGQHACSHSTAGRGHRRRRPDAARRAATTETSVMAPSPSVADRPSEPSPRPPSPLQRNGQL